ncbi:YbaB/EbfC family nucleoid-associated protein [Kineosporia sp. J2-2]|uniref:YbaB/EbfC family nucleoid-associated protein n=1 Tax=Kineosporia corallincola TaxID=2835133 RepID=A0ABS5TS62_9ACTN|nr:YbaB/EbfC family nucleoid-associated protein [Kineosporia corallincola]MBT0773623.1 YbaB/EbfC family nucleoid-associated protein [Kineosporia corallincola]
MNSPGDPMAEEMAAAVAEFARQRDQLAELTRTLETTTVDVTSDDGLITVSSTLSGTITGLRFKDDSHRDLAASELAAVLLELLDRARRTAAARAAELAGPLAQGPGLADTLVPGDPLGDALAGLDAIFRPGNR